MVPGDRPDYPRMDAVRRGGCGGGVPRRELHQYGSKILLASRFAASCMLTPAADPTAVLIAALSYRWDVPVATDWISRQASSGRSDRSLAVTSR